MKQIKLTQGQFALIDDDDFELVSQFKWYALKPKKIFYALMCAVVNGKRIDMRMHRLIMNAKKGQIIDHKDRNGLNNQKNNLRFCTHTENSRNSISNKGLSKYKGVSWAKAAKKWRAGIKVNNRGIYLGYYTNENEAAKAYNEAAIKYHGEFARLNIIPDAEHWSQ